MPAFDALLDWLDRTASADGSVGYTPQGEPEVEPVLLLWAARTAAGRPAPLPLPMVEEAFLKAQNSPLASWPFLLFPAMVSPLPEPLGSLVVSWIASLRPEVVEGVEGFDATIPGWSWVSGTASWVEPTAFALLSLARQRPGHPRIEAGVRLLLDRQCQDGGWNYGNPRMMGQELVSTPLCTGWAVLALVAAQQGKEACARAVPALREVLKTPGAPSLAVCLLALRALQEDGSDLKAALEARTGENGLGNRVDWTALGALALSSDKVLGWL